MFLPGMYGTFITNVLMYHDLLYNEAVSDMEFLPYIDSEVKEKARYNSHNGPYKDMIPGFHGQPDLDQVHRKTNAELNAYFEPMRNIPLGVHRIADYFDLDFENFFEKTLRILMVPKNIDDLEIWAERSQNAAPTDYKSEYWFPLLKKKGVENLPDYLKNKKLNKLIDYAYKKITIPLFLFSLPRKPIEISSPNTFEGLKLLWSIQ